MKHKSTRRFGFDKPINAQKTIKVRIGALFCKKKKRVEVEQYIIFCIYH
jgi:hypothetical protein